MTEHDELVIDLAGETVNVPVGGSLTLGREADFFIDENRYLHRNLAKVYDAGERWWIGNIGSSISFELYERSSGTRVKVAPGDSVPLPGNDTLMSFKAGPTNYEIDLRSGREIVNVTIAPPLDTISQSDIEFTASQKLLILALAEPALRAPEQRIAIPPSKQAAARLGWGMSKFNGKLENVCDRLAKIGVRGVKSTADAPATNRKQSLVEHCIRVGIVTPDDLYLLDQEQ